MNNKINRVPMVKKLSFKTTTPFVVIILCVIILSIMYRCAIGNHYILFSFLGVAVILLWLICTMVLASPDASNGVKLAHDLEVDIEKKFILKEQRADEWNLYEFRYSIWPKIYVLAHTQRDDVLLRCMNVAELEYSPQNRMAATILCEKSSKVHKYVKLVYDYDEVEQKIRFHIYYDGLCTKHGYIKGLIYKLDTYISDFLDPAIECIQNYPWKEGEFPYDMFDEILFKENQYWLAPTI